MAIERIHVGPRMSGIVINGNQRVEDETILSYMQLGVGDQFDGAFGHLFYKTPFTDYRLRVEYRFTPFGDKFLGVLDGIDALQREIDR